MIALLHLIFPFVQQIWVYKDKYDDWDEVDVGVDGKAIGIDVRGHQYVPSC
jgi:hypothetical protein